MRGHWYRDPQCPWNQQMSVLHVNPAAATVSEPSSGGSQEDLIELINWEDDPEGTLSRLTEHFRSLGFEKRESPFSIHDEKSVSFMSYIGAPVDVLNILKYGLIIPHDNIGFSYEEPNNRSADVENEFLIKTVNQWVSEGFMLEKNVKPRFVNPLTVVTQHRLLQGDIKKRPVLDQFVSFKAQRKP